MKLNFHIESASETLAQLQRCTRSLPRLPSKRRRGKSKGFLAREQNVMGIEEFAPWMCRDQSVGLADLVRSVLPKRIDGTRWEVLIVERFDQAGGDVEAGLVRVDKNWRQSVLEAGLTRLGPWYPLAVQPFEDIDPRVILQNLRMQWRHHRLTMCRAIAIEWYYRGGYFTGDLIIRPTFIVRARDRGEAFAHGNAAGAVIKALRATRSSERAHRNVAHAEAEVRNKARLLVANLGSDRSYNANDGIPLVSYEHLLPRATVSSLQLYGQEGVPFPALREAAIEAISDMKRDDILNLVIQLALDISDAQSRFAKRNELTPAEESALEQIVEM